MRFAALALSVVAAVGIGLLSVAAPTRTGGSPKFAEYRSPFDLAYSPDGKILAVSDWTAGKLVMVDGDKVAKEIALNGHPSGLAWTCDGKSLYVSECDAGTVAQIDPASGKVVKRIAVGPRPIGVVSACAKKLLIVCNSGTDTVSIVDAAAGKEAARLDGFREPFFVAVDPKADTAAVGNLVPAVPASEETASAAISFIDLNARKKVADLRLPAGSSCVRKLAYSPDGKWLYVVHTVGRTNLPTTQLERGWVNTNALSVIDAAKKELYATLLLDRPSEGAANPWGLAVSKDGNTIFLSIEGVHQVARIDAAALHKLLAGQDPAPPAAKDHYKRRITGIWPEIKKDPAKRADLVNDLAALYSADLIERITLPAKGEQGSPTAYAVWGVDPCKGPRGIALADGKVAVGCYFAGQVLTLDPASLKVTARAKLGDNDALMAKDPIRRGEVYFHDATLCFQHWLNCATCHPDGRADGMNWDLLNDGLGNPKNTKNLFLADKTPPSMSLGVRSSYEVATSAGYRHIQFRVVEPQVIEDTKAYIANMPCYPSPYLVDGKLSPLAQKGKAIFDSAKTKCATCHPAGLYTDLQPYDVGTKGELDRKSVFDTPTLIEMWRSGPYLHDGSAATLMDVLTTKNKGDKHGVTSHLSKDDLKALVAFLKSL